MNAANQYTDAATPLVKQFFLTREDFMEAFSSGYFYIEVLMVGLAIVMAGLIAYLIRRRIKSYLSSHTIKRIDPEFITTPLRLLSPLLSLLLLSMIKPLAEEYGNGYNLANSAIQLCLYFIVAKSVVLIVRSRLVAWFIAVVIMTVAILQVSGFMKSTTSYLRAMSFEVGTFKITMLNMINGIIILVIVFWIAGMLSRTLESYLRRSSSLSYNSRELIVKFFRIFVYFIALLITLSTMGVDLTAFAVFSGALGVGIGLGLQKVTANFVSGITLLLEKSIKLGDLIEVGSNTGFVRAMNVRYTLVETSDGREILVPNEELTSTRVTNWTHSNEHARVEVRAILDYSTDVKKVIKIMTDCAKAHPRCISYPEPVCWLREFGDSGLVFVLAFWIGDVHEGRNTPQSDVMLEILETFRRENIAFSPGTYKLLGDIHVG